MRSVLILDDLWQYIDGTAVKQTTNAETWMKNDSKASAVIGSEYHTWTTSLYKAGYHIQASIGHP